MSQYTQQYLNQITEIFQRIESHEQESIQRAAAVMADSIMKDQVIHVIGTGGHSNIAAEELIWRTGGLVPINAMLDAGIQVANGAKRSNYVERTPGYAKTVLESYGVKKGEVIIIVNAYGINAMTIDAALEAKKLGLTTIGVTSTGFANHVPAGHPSRHPSNKNLYEIVDVYVNCHLPLGDAIVQFEEFHQKIAPSSTLVNAFTINLMVVETVKTLLQKGFEPPVWMSANMPGGDEANRKWEEKYFGRIKHLR